MNFTDPVTGGPLSPEDRYRLQHAEALAAREALVECLDCARTAENRQYFYRLNRARREALADARQAWRECCTEISRELEAAE